MNRVDYAHVQQGYRPRTNPRPLAGLRGLGRPGYRPSAHAPLLGQVQAQPASLWTGITQNSLNPFVFLPEDWDYLTSPDPSILSSPSTSTLSNMAYGTLTQSQINELNAENTAGAGQAAGGDPALTAELEQDIVSGTSSIVNSYGGVAPGGGVSVSAANKPLGIPIWAWALMAIGSFLILEK